MRRMYDEKEIVGIASEEIDKVVPTPSLEGAGNVIAVNAAGTGYELVPVGALTIDGTTIRPANVYATGDITANNIIENMSGYSAEMRTPSGYTLENVFTGAVKTGNKLTLVYAFNITKNEGAPSYAICEDIAVPAEIYARLYETFVGSSSFLDNKEVVLFSSVSDYVKSASYLQKSVNNKITLVLQGTGNMIIGTKYYLRYEATFLLNDNLIPGE